MDPLSDLLRVVRFDGAFFYAVEATEPWSVATAATAELSPRIMPQVDHLISYHILIEGRCYGGLSVEHQVEMAPGDVIVFPHGDAHVMSSAPGLRPGPDVHSRVTERYHHTLHLGENGPRSALFVCGFLGCDRRPFNPLLAALPRQMHMRGMSNTGLGAFTRQLTEESSLGRAGTDSVLTRLAELMFVDVLRRYLDDLPAGMTGWLAGLRDDVVGPALTLLHARPGDDWTLAALARESASSRSNLTRRFTQLVGQPPMQYLAQWRMQVAANLLAYSSTKVAAIGSEVGYDSEAAFSRAFKKATGLAPGSWRDARRMART
jgi:AraC-like DNA-binding protein